MRIRTDLAVLLCFCPWQIAQADEGKVRSAFVPTLTSPERKVSLLRFSKKIYLIILEA